LINIQKIRVFLDNPQSLKGKIYAYFVIFLVFSSIIEIVLVYQYQEIYLLIAQVFYVIEVFTLIVFSIEYCVRIWIEEKKSEYIFSFYGISDLLAIAPTFLGFFGIPVQNTAWIRSVKLVRLIRVVKVYRSRHWFGGITGKTIPFIVLTIAFKGISVLLESQPWWPKIEGINIIIGVIGFSLAILLGTKLNVVNTRIYAIEDAICKIVGGLRDMKYQSGIKPHLIRWSLKLEDTLKGPYETKNELTRLMRIETDNLEKEMENQGIGGPNSAAFHRDVAYLLHRVTATTPEAYEKFLKTVMFAYTGVVIFTIPGIVGLISSILLVYILSGIYFLIDDMDKPLDYGNESFIDVRLDALEFFNGNGTDV